ncbi:alpha-1 2-Mannosidase [Fasciola hepatica]|uniref:alpha-1,2-Mannosidase n=1 Tax=Fasciola hepatica TaxID=6192 RepID=A0A4E0RJ32_FASHE|nr:alpha-1 2-Mannosidase [Fasciola hepatica]
MCAMRFLPLIFISAYLWVELVSMSIDDKRIMRKKVKEMFMHGYKSYRDHAYPADELMPLSCRGRHRYTHVSRGDVDDALGNFSLTMIDALDSLFLLGELDEFESAVSLVVRDVSFDSDVDVSVFETNIRVLGGLLGGHVAASLVRKANHSRLMWYNDDLLHMAVDIGNRLLPAFDTSTGIPFPRVNLKYGNRGLKKQEVNTCTACAGTMILEFAALSRLTGNAVYEEKAAHALNYLWKQRSRYSNLVGRVINVQSGEWIRRESGIGAGIDSYYEYLFKAYILLGETVYLHRFHTHYSAVKRYMSGPHSAKFPFLFLDVNMHHPSERVRTFMDALFAFWPGLQVLSGDVKPAIALHEFLFQVYKRNKLLPEAFTPDLNVHWGEHLLRPEFIESTYLLHQATGDPYYLDVGVQMVNDLEQYARVPCGYAAIQDVRTMQHQDRFDSFVLAETFKYFYLLFSEPSDLPLSLSEYVLTTEAHLLPLSFSPFHSMTVTEITTSVDSRKTTRAPPPTKTLPDKFGDRDHAAEAYLYRRGRCPDVNLEHFYGSPNICPDNQNATATPAALKPYCDVLDGPGLHQHRLFWLQWLNGRPGRPYCQESSDKQRWWHHIDLIRQPLRQLASVRKTTTQDGVYVDAIRMPLRAADFRPDDKAQLALLRRMGIELIVKNDGRLVFKHDQNMADSQALGVAGLLFVHDLVQLVSLHSEAEALSESTVQPRHVAILDPPSFGRLRFRALPAHFGHFPGESDTKSEDHISEPDSHSDAKLPIGLEVKQDRKTPSAWQPVVAPLRVAFPTDGCSEVEATGIAFPAASSHWNAPAADEQTGDQAHAKSPEAIASRGPMAGAIGIVRRGGCLFVQKARNLAKAGAVAGIVMDHEPDSSAARAILFTMSGEDDPSKNDVDIPFTLLFAAERDQLIAHMRQHWSETRQPTVAMLTKEFNATHAFLTSLLWFTKDRWSPPIRSLATSRPVASSPFSIYGKVSSDNPRAGRSPDQIDSIEEIGGLIVRRLPSIPISCETSTNLNTCLSDSVRLTGTQWLVSLIVNQYEVLDYVPVPKDTEETNLPNKCVHKWIHDFERAFSSLTLSESCRGLLLALFEALLRSASHSVDHKKIEVLNVPPHWISEMNRCLNYLKELSLFKSVFGIYKHQQTCEQSQGITRTPVSLSISFIPVSYRIWTKAA